MIFQGVTWGQYGLTIGSLVVVYYLWVAIRYYSEEINRTIFKRARGEQPKIGSAKKSEGSVPSPTFNLVGKAASYPSDDAPDADAGPAGITPVSPFTVVLDEVEGIDERVEESLPTRGAETEEVIELQDRDSLEYRDDGGLPASVLGRYKEIVSQGAELSALSASEQEDYQQAVSFTEALESYAQNFHRVAGLSRELFASLNKDTSQEEEKYLDHPFRSPNSFETLDLDSLMEAK